MTMIDKPALTFDEMLDQGEPAEELVPLCLNGRLVRQYEEVADRIAARAEARQAATMVPDGDPDVRLGGAPAPAGVPQRGVPDPEQPEADRLAAEMRRFTQVFRLTSVGARYNELLQEHPPRPDKLDAKRYHPADAEQGFNVSTFYAALVRVSIAEPEMTDGRWDKLMRGRSRISDAQFDRLALAAIRVNRQDANLPFSLDDLGHPPR